GKKLELLTNRGNFSFTVTSKAMEGEYQCIANNGVGEPAVASVFLRIIYPPEVTTEKLWIHTAPGSRIDLSCTVHANPDATGEGQSPNEWTKLVIPADTYSPGPLHSQSYTLTGLKASTVYEATVLSRNPFGWSRPSQILKFTTAGPDVNVEEKASQKNMEKKKRKRQRKETQLMKQTIFRMSFQ
ncbi:hypothetical protein LSTR_LSTR015180, partial [Laodelphax striatellus]